MRKPNLRTQQLTINVCGKPVLKDTNKPHAPPLVVCLLPTKHTKTSPIAHASVAMDPEGAIIAVVKIGEEVKMWELVAAVETDDEGTA